MKNIFLLFLFASTQFAFSQKKINLNLYYTIPYCGGAKPTPEMEMAAQKKHAYAKQTIVYVSEKGIIDSVKTDVKGTISLKLKYGTYKFYESWKYYKKTPDGKAQNLYDMTCLKTEWEKEIYKISISKKRYEEIKNYDLIKKCPHQMECLIEQNLPE
jgi:hypothetical protein